MTDADARAVVEFTRRLFPRNNWQADEWSLFIDDLRRATIDADQARAVVSEVRRLTGARNPHYPNITKRLRKLEADAKLARRKTGWAPEPEEQRGPAVTLAEFIAWAESRPVHPVSGHATNPVYQAALAKHRNEREPK